MQSLTTVLFGLGLALSIPISLSAANNEITEIIVTPKTISLFEPDMSRGRQPTFVRDIMPILNKVGCTSGPCHGSANGKNGFKLSLRGYDARSDYDALLYEVSGRRVNRAAPADSLMIAKPTQAVPHQGGFVLSNTRHKKDILRWISEGSSTRPCRTFCRTSTSGRAHW